MDDLTPQKRKMLEWIEAYIDRHRISPSYEEIADALQYRSKDTVKHHLKGLQAAEYLQFQAKVPRSIQILKACHTIPILGVIAAGGLVETFPETELEGSIDLSPFFVGKSRHQMAQYFALRVRGDSMIGAAIADGDIVILRKEPEPKTIKNGQIVAARVGTQTTLKYLFWSDRKIILKPANPSYEAIEENAEAVAIEGVFVGLVRGLV
jgi:repressor LexA